jgi:hypothetical protein
LLQLACLLAKAKFEFQLSFDLAVVPWDVEAEQLRWVFIKIGRAN